MTYTNAILFLLGLLGIITHCLIDINKLNRQPNININLKKYFKVEWAAILISFIVVIVAIIAKEEVVALHNAGNWVGLGFFGIGIAANSIITAFSNKTQRFIDININESKDDKK